MQRKTRTVEQCGMALALLEVPAKQLVQEEHKLGCPLNTFNMEVSEAPICVRNCNVAKYPMLRKPCAATYPTIVDGEVLKTHVESCEQCQGRGWLLVTTEEALLEAMLQPFHTVEIDCYPDGFGVRLKNNDDIIGEGNAESRDVALARALAAAEGLEVK